MHSVLAADRRRPGARWPHAATPEAPARVGRRSRAAGGVTRPTAGNDRTYARERERHRRVHPPPVPRADRPRRGVAAVTGGSAGLGRAVVRELAGLGYDVAVLARESEGLHAAAREVDLAGQRGLALAGGRRRRRRGRGRRRAGGAGARADRRLGQRRDDQRLRPFPRGAAGGVRARDPGHLPRLRQRHPGRAAADGAPERRPHRAGGLVAGVPRHPAAERVLRRQARHGGLHRVRAGRARPRRRPTS